MKQANFIPWLVGYFYLCVYTNVTAQIVFNKTFQTDTTSMLSVAVAPLQDGYLVTGGLNSLNNYSSFYMRRLDIYGNELFHAILDDGYNIENTILFGNSLVLSHDNNYLIAGTRQNEDTLTSFRVIKFSENGDVLWRYSYSPPDTLFGNAQIVCANSGYLLAGWSAKYYTPTNYESSQFYVQKIDEQGHRLWQKNYGTNAILLYSEQTQDSGFVLSGYCYTAATGYDMYAVKTDSLGVVQWEKTYGTNQDDGGCAITQLADGNYCLLGSVKMADDTYNFYIAQLSTDGEMTWHQQYPFNEHCGIGSLPYRLPNGNVAIIVFDYGDEQGDTKKYHLTQFSTTNGDIIWQSSQIHSNLGDTEDYLRDIEPTADGGFVLAGFNYGSPQSSWVVKTDSLGNTCSFINCDSTIYTGTNTATPALPTKANNIQVYPNPANNNFTLSYQLPPNIAFGVLELYNTLGQKVLYKQAPQALTKINISVAQLPAGVYLYRFVTINGEVASGKIIVSR